jgi:protoheme IX farnesyltransferase
MINIITSLPKLMRLGVSLAVSFSAITGYIVATSFIDLKIVSVFFGVFFLAGGASALNQYQERNIDQLMSRTKSRPIPAKKITKTTGLILSIGLCLTGFSILLIKTGTVPALLGLLNILWYNGLYTSLKKKTVFAVVPGSLTGVTPVLIGWSAAGAYLLSPEIIFISFFIYMWQIPHFWLLLIKNAEDYRKAGLGTFDNLLSENQVKRILFMWILSTSFTSLLLAYFGIIQSTLLFLVLIILNILISLSFYQILFKNEKKLPFKKAFIEINAFMFIVFGLLIIDSLF